MQLKGLVVYVVVSCVALGVCFGTLCDSSRRGDVNGDHRVNLLDAEIAAREVLTGAAPVNNLDVNRDGQVDIYDVQFILSCAQASSSEQPVPSGKKLPDAIASSSHSWTRVDTDIIVLLRPPSETMYASVGIHGGLHVVFSPLAERYLFTLTANAPPFLS